jgi:hypothetical protein
MGLSGKRVLFWLILICPRGYLDMNIGRAAMLRCARKRTMEGT